MMPHVPSWGKSPNPIGDAGLKFVIWVDIFLFEDKIFVSLSNFPDVHSSLSHISYLTNYI